MLTNYSDRVDRKNAVRSLYTDDSHPRPIPQKETDYELKEYYVTIDSRDRNRVLWPSANNFQVKMDAENSYQGALIGRSFKNVRCIEVVNAQFPNTNHVTDQMYLYLCFPEIDGIYEATNVTGSKAIAKLIPGIALGNYITVEFDKNNRPKKLFPNKGIRLGRLTVEFRTYNGELFDFGKDNPHGIEFNPKLQTSITLRIIVQVPNTL